VTAPLGGGRIEQFIRLSPCPKNRGHLCPTDYFPIEQVRMFRCDAESWLPFGPVEGK
jgi:hypothetical protein